MTAPAPGIAPLRVPPPLDPGFTPTGRARRALEARVRESGVGVPVVVALEQPGGTVVRRETIAWPDGHPERAATERLVLRLVRSLLWACGGTRLHLDGPASLVEAVRRHHTAAPTGRFDAAMTEEFYGRSLEILATPSEAMPAHRGATSTLGGHLEGCRIGFDLGASDRKVAAVVDGEVVFSDEVPWDPATHDDPRWHRDEIDAGLRSAAAHLPRVDAIGGSAAGVYVDGEVRAASLFRSVPRDRFEGRVRGLFRELGAAWGVPFVVVNDGEVTALAGSMATGAGALLGIAMGSSQAGGYVTRDGALTTWLDELAFVPVDDAPDAPVDEWSGERGCGVQYFSQQAVARLLGPAGIEVDPALTLPERLVVLQERMAAGDPCATPVYETIGAYLGYALIDYLDLYDVEHVLLLGRVLTGDGGAVIARVARSVLEAEGDERARAIAFHEPSERDKRHGQAVAAASLPELRR